MIKKITKNIIILFIVVFISGCATIGKSVDDSTGYLAGYFAGFDHNIKFRDLVNGKDIKIKFNSGKKLSVVKIPPGVYAPLSISGRKWTTTYRVDLPRYLMTKIVVEPGTVTFLGKMDYENKFFNLNPFVDGTISTNYPYDDFVKDFNEKYLDNNIRKKSLTMMSFD